MSKLCEKADATVLKDDIMPSDTNLLTCTIKGITTKLELLKTLDKRKRSTGPSSLKADDYTTTIREYDLTRCELALRRITEPETLISTPFVTVALTETLSSHLKKVDLLKLTLMCFCGDILQW